jgi:CheY-like chemotaxis protein
MINDCLLTREAPVVLVVADERGTRSAWRTALEAAGWQVRWTADGAAACTIAAKQPIALVLLDLGGSAATLRDSAVALRDLPGPGAAVPIVGLRLGPSDNDPKSNEVDGVIVGAGADSLARALESWRPLSLAPTRRIAAVFGAGPIAGMIERLARRLEAALKRLDQTGGLDQMEAHRLAGLCGTLGFGQAHAAWLDLSLGDCTAISEVRRTTRLTLSAIARGL